MPERPSLERPVVVVGAGWAGLAAAVELCAHGLPVVVLEAARQFGGRARSIRYQDMIVDNGQHLLIGAYQSMLDLMDRVQVDQQRAFLRLPLTLRLLSGSRTSLYFKAPQLPAPYHLLGAMLGARGLSMSDRIRALSFGRKLGGLVIPGGTDISVQALLHSEGQTPALIRKLWEPLCIATLNTAPDEASAEIFVRVLQDAFLRHRSYSDLLIPRLELSDLLPRPCADYLQRQGGRIELGRRVSGLVLAESGIRAVNIDADLVEASHVILATPHAISRRLMSRHDSLYALRQQLSELGNEPIATLYLQYPPDTSLPQPVVGLEDGLSQWVFDRRICGQPGLMAVVISAKGPHTRMSKNELTRTAAAELAASFPAWPAHRQSALIREKRATFSSRVGINRYRPDNRTPVRGLWLAGDYTANGLPATLEGAVRSGISCANAILGAAA